MTQRVQLLRERLARGEPVDVRGHGRAGGGLLLALRSFAAAISTTQGLEVRDSPLLSRVGDGATVCAGLRIARGAVADSSAALEPDVLVLMNETAAEDANFAEGTRDALYVVNTWHSPQMTAARYRLGGTVVTVAGDDLGIRFLGRPLANVAVLAALTRATGLVDPAQARSSLEARLLRRRLSRRIVDANLALFDASQDRIRVGEFPAQPRAHEALRASGLPQSAPRTSAKGRGLRAPPGLEFVDAASACNGCSLCVVQCPAGLIEFELDRDQRTRVHAARFREDCKLCRECIAACALDLFQQMAVARRSCGHTLASQSEVARHAP